MRKIFTLMLGIVFYFSSANAATTYLVQQGTGASWSGVTGTVVNLSTVNAGGAATFNAWFTDKSLTTPTFAGAKFAVGDMVWVINGTYTLTGTISLFSGVAIYGGFAGTETATSQRALSSSNAWDFSNATVFDGASSYTVMNGGSASVTTLVDGVTIQNGANPSTSAMAGGAKISGAFTSMQNCIVKNCTSTNGSTGSCAGVYVSAGATLQDSYIHNNSSSYAGGGTLTGSNCSLLRCKVENNSATASAGGFYIYSTSSNINVSNCSFISNTAATNGGAIHTYINNTTNAQSIIISNCTFTSNSAGTSGGAAYLGFSGTYSNNAFTISNCSFNSNTATGTSGNSGTGGGAIYFSTCSLDLYKCTFDGNSTGVTSGGAITIQTATSSAIRSCKFTNNTAGTTSTSSGSAIYSKTNYVANNCVFAKNTGLTSLHFYTAATASTFQNCTFASNLTATATESTIGLLALTPKYSFTNCLFYKSSTFSSQTPTISYCGFDIAIPAGGTNSITGISTATFKDDASGDYSLASGTSAIDAGTDLSAATYSFSDDMIGTLRPQGSAWDMGAYEASVATSISSVVHNTSLFTVLKNGILPNVDGNLHLISFGGQHIQTVSVHAGNVILLPSGNYILKLVSGAGVYVQKVNI